jgi:hypothetical protein
MIAQAGCRLNWFLPALGSSDLCMGGMTQGLIPGGGRDFSLHRHIQTVYGIKAASCLIGTGDFSWCKMART